MKKMQIIGMFAVLCAFFLTTATAFAQGVNGNAEVRAEVNENRMEIRMQGAADARSIKEEAKEKLELLRANGSTTKAEIRGNLEDMKADLKENRQAMVAAFKENQDQFKKDVQAKRATLKAEIDAKRQERKGDDKRLGKDAKERVGKRIEAIFTRLNAKIDRLVKIDTKLAARINAHNSEGHNTAPATSALVTAQASLSVAKANVAAAKVAADAELNATTTSEVLRGLVKTGEESVVKAGEAYMKVLKEIVALPRLQATSTVISN